MADVKGEVIHTRETLMGPSSSAHDGDRVIMNLGREVTERLSKYVLHDMAIPFQILKRVEVEVRRGIVLAHRDGYDRGYDDAKSEASETIKDLREDLDDLNNPQSSTDIYLRN